MQDHFNKYRKSIWQYPIPTDDKTSQQVRIDGKFLNLFKGISKVPTPKIILHGLTIIIPYLTPYVKINSQ